MITDSETLHGDLPKNTSDPSKASESVPETSKQCEGMWLFCKYV